MIFHTHINNAQEKGVTPKIHILMQPLRNIKFHSISHDYSHSIVEGGFEEIS